MTEKERRDADLWYDANTDAELLAERLRASDLCFELNGMRPSDTAGRMRVLTELLGGLGDGAEVLSPLQVDYGYNVSVGEGSFINHGAYLMDCAPVSIGSHVFCGPDLGVYTAEHPLLPKERNLGLERALPVTIQDDCWLGAGVRLMPGVTIGAGTVIGAGSLVTHDIPAGVLAFGSPCRVIRPLTTSDALSQ